MSPGVTAADAAVWSDVKACPLCSSGPSCHSQFASFQAPPHQLQYLICKTCGLVFQSPRLGTVALEEYYRHEYHKRSHSQEPDAKKDHWVQRRRAEYIRSELAKSRQRVRRHLDFGCSSGILMQVFQQDLGCESWGIELSQAERAEAAGRGFSVAPTLGDLPSGLRHSFDLVSLSHVLEHLPEPLDTLQTIRQHWLAPDGVLVVEVPNLFGHPAFEIGHLTAFSAASLRETLSQAGFKPYSIRPHGKPYSRMLPLFLLAMAKPSSRSRSEAWKPPLTSWIRFRRWLGMGVVRSARFLGGRLLRKPALEPWK